jgi:hypothetical protein
LQADRSTLGRIETGERAPSAEQLTALMDLYGVCGRLRGVYERPSRVARATAADAPVRLWFSGFDLIPLNWSYIHFPIAAMPP